MPGQNPDGTLEPPTAHETTDITLKDMSKQEGAMRILTMDESDALRATRAFTNHPQTHENLLIFTELHNHALDFTDLIIKSCPAGKERSQALGSLQQCVQWAKASIENR